MGSGFLLFFLFFLKKFKLFFSVSFALLFSGSPEPITRSVTVSCVGIAAVMTMTPTRLTVCVCVALVKPVDSYSGYYYSDYYYDSL